MVAEFKFPPIKVPRVGAQGALRCGGASREFRSDTRSFNQDPGDLGPFLAFEAFGDEKFSATGIQYHGRWFLPVVESTGKVATNCPLVLIVHARFTTPGQTDGKEHLRYRVVASHLASHGFAVFSVNRSLNAGEPAVGDLIDATIQHLFSKSPNRVFLRDEVILLGHSSGGRAVIENARRVRTPSGKFSPALPHDLKAVVLLAPAVHGLSNSVLVGLAAHCSAVLGLTVSTDDDADTYGSKESGLPMQSIVRVYDLLPLIEKDLVFAVPPPVPPPPPQKQQVGHYFQDENFVRAYVTAFLHRHISKNGFYTSFLKYQIRPPSIPLGWKVVHLHQDRSLETMTFADLDPISPKIESLGGLKVDTPLTYAVDEFSPHVTRAIRIKLNRTNPGLDMVSMTRPVPLDLSGFTHVAFRIGQGVEPKPSQFDARVILNQSSVLLSTASGLIAPPEIVSAPVSKVWTDLTKSLMRTHVIPLNKFTLLTSPISSVRFDFSVNPIKSLTTFFLDSIQFWKA